VILLGSGAYTHFSISTEPGAEQNTPFRATPFRVINFTMRQKTGNGHNVDLDTFLEDIKTVVRDGQELLKTGAGQVKEKALYGARTTDQAIRKSPYQTLGIIFGVGLIIGLVAAGALSGSSEEKVD